MGEPDQCTSLFGKGFWENPRESEEESGQLDGEGQSSLPGHSPRAPLGTPSNPLGSVQEMRHEIFDFPTLRVQEARASKISPGCPDLPMTLERITDPNGDLCVVVGTNMCIGSQIEMEHKHKQSIVFCVDSGALTRVSKVFSGLLYGNLGESREPSGETEAKWLIDLPDDDSRYMEILFNIMHHNFSDIPSDNDPNITEILYELAVITDKYDCVHLLRPWINNWLLSLERQVFEANNNIDPRREFRYKRCSFVTTTTTIERLSWIAWVFGDRDLFTWSCMSLFYYSGVKTINTVATQPLGSSFQDTLEPLGLKG